MIHPLFLIKCVIKYKPTNIMIPNMYYIFLKMDTSRVEPILRFAVKIVEINKLGRYPRIKQHKS